MAVNLDDFFTSSMASNHQQGMSLTTVVDRNLTQGFGVVLETTLQAQADVTDDPGLIAALQTASRSPEQGANKP